jgi:hypothetical protein
MVFGMPMGCYTEAMMGPSALASYVQRKPSMNVIIIEYIGQAIPTVLGRSAEATEEMKEEMCISI